MSSSANHNEASAADKRHELLQRQTAALEQLAVVSDPAYAPRKKAIAKLVSLVLLGSGVVLGGYEFALFLLEAYERRAMVANWVEASRELYEVEGNPEAALALLSRASEFDPQAASVLKLDAYVQGMQTVEVLFNLDRPFSKEDVSQYGKAAGQAVMLERVDPDSPDWAILRGQLALVAGDPDRARAFLEKALELEGGNAFATQRMGLVHRSLSLAATDVAVQAAELAACKALLHESLALNPKSKWTLLWLGSIALEQDADPKTALEFFEQAVAIDSRFANAYHSIGQAQEQLEDLVAAERAYVRALELRPDLSVSLAGLAYVYGARDMYEIGLRYARKATEVDVGRFGSWTMRGRLAREWGKVLETRGNEEDVALVMAEAIDAYTKALDLDPRNADAYIDRSALFQYANKLAEAGDDARNAVLFAKEDPFAWNALARVQAKGGFHQEACASFSEVITRDAAFDEAYLGRAASHEALGDLPAAAADFESAVLHATDDLRADILLARGLFLERRGELQRALADFEAARTLQSGMFDAWLAEAAVLLKLDRAVDAAAAARKARMLRPESAEARAFEEKASQVSADATALAGIKAQTQ